MFITYVILMYYVPTYIVNIFMLYNNNHLKFVPLLIVHLADFKILNNLLE